LVSSNVYNGSGPKPFPDGGICPVCAGSGQLSSTINEKQETVHIAVITDSKYFINIADALNISPNSIQTIFSIDLLYKLNNAKELIVNNASYQKAGSPQFCGLAEHKYVIMMWSST
jgi:hypothetical protein